MMQTLARDGDPSQTNTSSIEDEYGKIIELHKFYLEIGTKTAAGSFAIVGAIVTYVSQQTFPEGTIPIALALPLVLSIGNSVVFLGGTRFAKEFKAQVEAVQARLGATWRPHVELIVGMTLVIGLLFAVMSIGLAAIMLFPGWLPRVAS